MQDMLVHPVNQVVKEAEFDKELNAWPIHSFLLVSDKELADFLPVCQLWEQGYNFEGIECLEDFSCRLYGLRVALLRDK